MSNDVWVKRGADDYAEGFNKLLPTGPAWPREPGTALQDVITGLAQIWGTQVETLAALLLTEESDPRITAALLSDWERAFGLPDTCLLDPETFTVADRRIALVKRITQLGQQDRVFLIALALSFGYTITITEYRPFMVGIDRCGDNRTKGDGVTLFQNTFGQPILDTLGKQPIANGAYSEYPYILGPPENRYYWKVHMALARLSWFRASSGQVGVDPHLRIGLATDLECLLRRVKPAHTDIIFDYSGLGTGGAMAGTP